MSEQTQDPGVPEPDVPDSGVPEPDEPRVDEDGGAAAAPDPSSKPLGAVERSADDTDTGWGEAADAERQDRDQWLRAERPPHWG
jgi:hypothetical protein